MTDILLWLESVPLGVWMRESPSLLAFPTVLFLHTLGLAMLVGLNAALALWILGGKRIGVDASRGLTQVMWAGFGINAISGVLLLLAYPAKALTNPVFYLKLALIAAALACFYRLKPHAFAAQGAVGASGEAVAPPAAPARPLAAAVLVLWAAAILTGRLLAYTHSVLMAAELTR